MFSPLDADSSRLSSAPHGLGISHDGSQFYSKALSPGRPFLNLHIGKSWLP